MTNVISERQKIARILSTSNLELARLLQNWMDSLPEGQQTPLVWVVRGKMVTITANDLLGNSELFNELEKAHRDGRLGILLTKIGDFVGRKVPLFNQKPSILPI